MNAELPTQGINKTKVTASIDAMHQIAVTVIEPTHQTPRTFVVTPDQAVEVGQLLITLSALSETTKAYAQR